MQLQPTGATWCPRAPRTNQTIELVHYLNEGRKKGGKKGEAEAPTTYKGVSGGPNDRRERKNDRIEFDLDADAVSPIDSVMWCTVLFVRLF